MGRLQQLNSGRVWHALTREVPPFAAFILMAVMMFTGPIKVETAAILVVVTALIPSAATLKFLGVEFQKHTQKQIEAVKDALPEQEAEVEDLKLALADLERRLQSQIDAQTTGLSADGEEDSEWEESTGESVLWAPEINEEEAVVGLGAAPKVPAEMEHEPLLSARSRTNGATVARLPAPKSSAPRPDASLTAERKTIYEMLNAPAYNLRTSAALQSATGLTAQQIESIAQSIPNVRKYSAKNGIPRVYFGLEHRVHDRPALPWNP